MNDDQEDKLSMYYAVIALRRHGGNRSVGSADDLNAAGLSSHSPDRRGIDGAMPSIITHSTFLS